VITKTGNKDLLFDAAHARPSPPLVRPIDEQDDRESQKLWAQVTRALLEKNHEVATDEKTRIEDMQRDEAALRSGDGVEWLPKLFRRIRSSDGMDMEDLDWILASNL
jgi:hypothetical protein